ncbi:hypothetical protein C8Q70DRAFT_1057688 [Cubamyces menziesii]|uniref:Uncharacterized protein n=1 Tax=Trametes cubensis TaxID=1111947 RepID=A0AAD7U3B6_9APHY|nr:hypothetical protein C8Q70DRAFT_1057688 [Cubamyces menziesii]KAJ8495446.1 hypothetical protein ONZ51_g1726 [Trametes cubensis]
MQFKTFIALASVAAVAFAAPSEGSADAENTLTTAVTTDTFTASKILQSFEQTLPWVTTITTHTIWTVTHTVTMEVPSGTPSSAPAF